MMYSVGQYVFNVTTRERVQIIEVSEAWGFVSYKLYNPSSGLVYKLPANEISAEAPEETYQDSFLRYVLLLCKIKNETSTGILSKLSSGIIPLPHQLHVLNRTLSNNNIRYILADEVGLGKTIEAGLIIKELKTRGLIKRILIVCPKGLVTQWNLEMQEKFGEKFNIILPEDYDTIRKITDTDDVYGQFDQVISPMDSIKPLERRIGWDEARIEKYNEERIYSIINSGWDLVVIDEAHRVAGSTGEVARYKLGNLLSQASPYLLLLTATPHNGKTEPFLRLIRLVDEKAFPNYKAIVKEQVAPYVIRTEKRNAIDNNGDKLFKNRKTKIISLHWDERHSMQRKLYEMVTEYVSKNYNKAMRNCGKNMWFVFLLIMMQRLVTSSTSAVRQSLEKRVAVLEEQEFKYQSMTEEEFAEMDLEENLEDAISAISLDIKEEIAQLTAIIAVAKQAEFQYSDVKVEPLLALIDDLYAEEKHRKIIIFTEFVATQNYLKDLLTGRRYSISTLNGSMSIDERNAVLAEFKTKTDILISTDAGGEGLNLQFSNCVINFDLPWNPMKIEQRIGRVDRIGQQRDVVVFNFVLADTVENRVRDVLEEKLSVILKELGVDKYADVLDGEAAGINFTDAYMSSIRNPKNIDLSIRPIEEDFKKQVQNTMRFHELITEEKDLTSLVGAESSFDFENALRLMVTYYENSMGNPYMPIEHFSINDAIIVKHLKKELQQDTESPVMNVSIQDFPNEKGYFMLWQLAVSPETQGQKIIPIFINIDFILRPMAGMKIWDALLDTNKVITVSRGEKVDFETWMALKSASQEFAYDTFLALKSGMEKRNEETHRKYLYALDLRIEAAQHIGIENIRSHKLKLLAREKAEVQKRFEDGKRICPVFKLVMLVRME
jgi:superfamily II DNA or RNA helicase